MLLVASIRPDREQIQLHRCQNRTKNTLLVSRIGGWALAQVGGKLAKHGYGRQGVAGQRGRLPAAGTQLLQIVQP